MQDPQPLAYLDRAIRAVEPIAQKIMGRATPSERSAAVFTLEAARAVDPESAVLVARTLQYSEVFGQLIREQVSDMSVGTRYEKLAELFASIQGDAKRLVTQLADGRLDWKEKLSNSVNDAVKGTVADRFEKIKRTFLDVTEETKNQLQREDLILRGYQDFRGALKEAEIAAERMRVKQDAALASATVTLADAQAAAESAPEGEARLRAQLTRDTAIRAKQDADSLYQAIKSIAENLRISYQVSETVVAKLQQTHDAKKAVFTQSSTFFTTNEHVMSALAAAFTSQAGLHEATRATSALTKGIEGSLEVLAETSGHIEKDALAVAYGKTISAESVKKLADAVLAYQTESRALIGKYREESTVNANEIVRIVEETKRKFVENQLAPAAQGGQLQEGNA